MNTLICAGGTGIRVLAAVLHLCAAGLGPKRLRLLVIDPDRSNGNGDRTSTLVDRYRELHRRFGGGDGRGAGYFRTELDLLEDGRETGLRIWSPVGSTDRLGELLETRLLSSAGLPEDLWQLFFTGGELEMDLSEGFRARPSVGAAAMSFVELQKDEPPWKLLLQRLENDMTQEEGARVFLTGSVFGGTGAAALFPIARFLRVRLPGERLRIAAAPLTPYFSFASAEAERDLRPVAEAAESKDFPTHTRGAVDFYHHLEEHGESPFDVQFWLGDSNPRQVPYAPGGSRQRNPAHVVELATGLAALDFFRAPGVLQDACYAGVEQPGTDDDERQRIPVRWQDLPLARLERPAVVQAIARLWLSGVIHLGFAGPLVRLPELERAPHRVPWYWQRFARHGLSLATAEAREALDLLDDFLVRHHFPWWREIQDEDGVCLANRAALPDEGETRLDRLRNLFWPDDPGGADPDAIDRFYTDMNTRPSRVGGESAAEAYLALLASASDRYLAREVAGAIPEEE